MYKTRVTKILNFKLKVSALIGVFSLYTLFIPQITQAAPLVKVFEELSSQSDKDRYGSDFYQIWVKPIPVLGDQTGLPSGNYTVYDPSVSSTGYKKSFAYKSINDVETNDSDSERTCYQYHYEDGNGNILYRLEARVDDPNNAFSGKCDDSARNDDNPNTNPPALYEDVYKEVMTHTNNWTQLDIGHANPSTTNSAARVFIELNMGQQLLTTIDSYDIRPNRFLATGNDVLDITNQKFIKVRFFGALRPQTSGSYKKVLILDVMKPQGDWSGQFSVSFNNATVTNTAPNNVSPFNPNVSFVDDLSEQHPLFIFANALPDWYKYLNSTDQQNYDGCPKSYLTPTYLPETFAKYGSWTPGSVVDSSSTTPEGDTIDDIILKSWSNNLCIPGGVYVKGRIIHHYDHHPDGDSSDHGNVKGVKIVGRGILSGIHMKHRWDPKTIIETIGSVKIEHPSGGGWYGHLIDIRHKNTPFHTDEIEDASSNYLDCYYRDESVVGNNVIDQNVNCVQGIVMVDGSKVGVYSGGSRIDVDNVKIMSWHIETNGIGSGKGSKIKNVFIKPNDDGIALAKANMEVENTTIWRQRWGSAITLGWNLKANQEDTANSSVNGLNVVRFDQEPTGFANGNAAIVALRHLMGGTVRDIELRKIVVEEKPYQLINLQLNDENSYRPAKRSAAQQLIDGTGVVNNVTINGVFSPVPYEIDLDPLVTSQKSVISVFDEVVQSPPPSTLPTRQIGNVKFNNICIDHGNYNRLLVSWLQPGQAHSNNWAESIYDYFIFTDESSKFSSSTTPTEPPAKDEDIISTVSTSDGDYVLGPANQHSPICSYLNTENNCTIENFINCP